MPDRSALDREGAGSSPASGFQTANPGYAAFQLASALAALGSAVQSPDRERASDRVAKWQRVLEGMMHGQLSVGSRTPVPKAPAWATLEVVTGGFATGGLLAGGSVQEHEQRTASRVGVPVGASNRAPLNWYYLTEAGQAELRALLTSGRFEVEVPEEGALLTVAWLLKRGHPEHARAIVDAIGPFFSTLRFYPKPADRTPSTGETISLQSIPETITSLDNVQAAKQVLAQRETIRVWLPLYDGALRLFAETVEGTPPARVGTTIQGGWPCQHYPDGWKARASDLVRRIDQAVITHNQSSRATHRKSSLAQLLPALRKCAVDPGTLSGREVGGVRLVMARASAKRGLMDSAAWTAARDRQEAQARTPLLRDLAQTVVHRLRGHGGEVDVKTMNAIVRPVDAREAAVHGLDAGCLIPEAIRRKAERCLCASAQELVNRNIVPSGDVLAAVMPQITSNVRAASIIDPELRLVYAAVYRAFRSRRSLLLLNLQSQVKIEELPWVRACEAFRDANTSAQEMSHRVLKELLQTTLTAFPHAILPNKLLQEVRALLKGAGKEVPIVDELAADIFMGQFTPKYTVAAKLAAELLCGTVYERYYGIDYAAVRRFVDERPKPKRRWALWKRNRSEPEVKQELAAMCAARAGAERSSGDPATNGMIIEQAQIITTQNLGPLVGALSLHQDLQERLSCMASKCFVWVCRRLQVKQTEWHAKLVTVKVSAYAWRQMLVYLSLMPQSETASFMVSTLEHFDKQPETFRRRFGPAIAGLRRAIEGCQAADDNAECRCFTGWSKNTHWLLTSSPEAKSK